jgi:hypothetical protein
MLLSVAPPIQLELAALENAARELGVATTQSLDELLLAYDGLDRRDDLRRRLVSPVEVLEPIEGIPETKGERTRTIWSRVLRATAEVEDFIEHLAVIAGGANAPAEEIASMSGRTPIQRVLDQRACLEAGYSSLLDALRPRNALGRLCETIDRIFDIYGERRKRFRIVLIVDQFEEIFTHYQDRPAAAQLRGRETEGFNWRLRHKFFREFEEAYLQSRGSSPDEQSSTGRLLPIRYVIGMREDYVSHLDALRSFVPDLDENAYRLNLLVRPQAKAAIREPARMFGLDYTDECLEVILDELCSEEQYVSPGILQMVCSQVWMKRQSAANGGASHSIDTDTFRKAVGGVSGVVDAFVSEAVELATTEDREEALEILQALITTERTRNIVAYRDLVEAPFRFSAQRMRVIGTLEQRGLVRIESRYGRRFVEISHELLIDPVFKIYQDAVAGSADYHALHRGALRALSRVAHIESPVDAARLISAAEFRIAHRFRQRINFDWQDGLRHARKGPEIMYRAALEHVASAETDPLEFWARSLTASRASGEAQLITVPPWQEERATLGASEWRAVSSNPNGFDLDRRQLETVYRSALLLAGPHESGSVEYWAKRIANA